MGANIEIVDAGGAPAHRGPYGGEGFVLQGLAPLPAFDGNRPVLSSRVVAGKAGGMGIREQQDAVTTDRARSCPTSSRVDRRRDVTSRYFTIVWIYFS